MHIYIFANIVTSTAHKGMQIHRNYSAPSTWYDAQVGCGYPQQSKVESIACICIFGNSPKKEPIHID